LCSPLNLHCAAIIDLFAGIQSKGAPFHCFKKTVFHFRTFCKKGFETQFLSLYSDKNLGFKALTHSILV